MKSTLRPPSTLFGRDLPSTSLEAALTRQRQRGQAARLQEEHAGALDIERLIGRLPDARGEAGRALSSSLRQHARYVRLTRPLGAAPQTASQTDVPDRPILGSATTALGWLGRLSGLRSGASGAPTLAPGTTALLLPGVSGGLLLAEQRGEVWQFLPSSAGFSPAGSDFTGGHWQPLPRLEAVQTGPQAQVNEAALGLERLPTAWSQLSSARRRERARRVRRLSLALGLALVALSVQLLTDGLLWLLLGPALLGVLWLLIRLEQTCAPWVRQGSALRLGDTLERSVQDSRPALDTVAAASHLKPSTSHLSAHTLARVRAFQAELHRAYVSGGLHLIQAIGSDLDGLLEDRASYPAPDTALDTLLEGQLCGLRLRLEQLLAAERQRAHDLSAQRLRRETVDPHF